MQKILHKIDNYKNDIINIFKKENDIVEEIIKAFLIQFSINNTILKNDFIDYILYKPNINNEYNRYIIKLKADNLNYMIGFVNDLPNYTEKGICEIEIDYNFKYQKIQNIKYIYEDDSCNKEDYIADDYINSNKTFFQSLLPLEQFHLINNTLGNYLRKYNSIK